MRINVYSQELYLHTDDLPRDAIVPNPKGIDLITQEADTGVTYSAVRMYLHSSERLHHTMSDDDRSGITFWLPRSESRREVLAGYFEQMARLVREAPPETGLD